MARNSRSTIPDEELASSSLGVDPDAGDHQQEDEVDSRLRDLETEPEPAFLRARKRVPVRRGALPEKTVGRLKKAIIALALLSCVAAVVIAVYRYGGRSSRFRLDSSDDIDVIGSQHVTRAQIMQVMGGDIGRNVFFIPLDERRKQLESLPWVETAAVSRLLPDRVRVEIRERTPVAFARMGSRIFLVDANGVLMDMVPRKKGAASKGSQAYSFPVIMGIGEDEPGSTRLARMKIYLSVIDDLDSGGGRYSQDLSEVDLSDPEDVKITTSDADGHVLIHLGSSNFLDRYNLYISNVKKWRRQYPDLSGVDLRYDQQVILNTNDGGTVQSSAATPGSTPIAAKKKGGR